MIPTCFPSDCSTIINYSTATGFHLLSSDTGILRRSPNTTCAMDLHMVIFQPHKGGILIGFAVTVPFSQCRQLLLVFFQPWKMLFPQLFKLFLGRLCCFFEFFVQRGKSVPELIALNRSGCFIPAQ